MSLVGSIHCLNMCLIPACSKDHNVIMLHHWWQRLSAQDSGGMKIRPYFVWFSEDCGPDSPADGYFCIVSCCIISLVSSAFSSLCISWCFWSCATTRGQVSVCSPMSTASGSTSYNQLILKITNTTVCIQPNRDQGGERITQRVSVLCVPFVVLCDERETQNSLWYLNKSATCSLLWVLTLVKCPIKVLIYEQINECVFQLPVTA